MDVVDRVDQVIDLLTRSSRSDSGLILSVSGLPAAGKSTLVQGITSRWQESGNPSPVIIDKDLIAREYESAVMSHLTGNPSLRDGEVYREMALPWTAKMIGNAAQMTSGAGLLTLIDRPSLEQGRKAMSTGRTLAEEIAEDIGCRVDLTIWLTVTEDEQMSRMIARGADRDAPKLEDFPAYRASLGSVTDFPEHLCDLWLN